MVNLADVDWLSKALSRKVCRSDVASQDLQKINKTSALQWTQVQFEDSSEKVDLVMKFSNPGDEKAKMLGLAREALFYKMPSELACSSLKSVLPKVWHAEGDLQTGAKTILLEDLSSCVQAGYFFGAGNVNNWSKNLAEETEGFDDLTAAEVTRLSFSTAAKLHSLHWNNAALRGNSSLAWLRGLEWLDGKDQRSWEASQANVARLWAKVKAKNNEGSLQVELPPRLIACLDASIAKCNWPAYQHELASRPFTLTHGDFHPANFMVRPGGGNEVVLIDWEVVGVGSGPQDLGQFMISHAEPALREEIERDVVAGYHRELIALNPSISLTIDECWDEYIAGGLGRWLWFIPLLLDTCPPKMGQFFVDQVFAFVLSHHITPETAPMPRA
mmetsp:Transcript_7323/g.15842  ORF Transcript_7323/g.15842 Transcript_7323/m.15842 type:complete len:387 (-) Transcript_7323:121-1281(-)|eukprot:CAMPEP_0113303722 /NCGR_PEP_ID=MMETSP0010_2-20120614/4021_1 /TAXON_ID=216773 ORGANISM="Corethron hystrix, Strain 308" /NCGR_SAMPLE_ID=MMETSP0010_2 /ASSEMBLY_ACC=CAM_ASM_000155 /LENGTH=386 /DNA_ID=CAMNT_0000157769 /DNA_START=71 /DNA_END=1231 /DNA_ORIENTATION=- /assembly_acc=CAM_ASM_000155